MLRALSRMVMTRLATFMICSFLIVLAAIRLSVLYHDYILSFENGLAIEAGTYILVVAVSVWQLSKLRALPEQKHDSKTEQSPHLRRVASQFAQGFISGFF